MILHGFCVFPYNGYFSLKKSPGGTFWYKMLKIHKKNRPTPFRVDSKLYLEAGWHQVLTIARNRLESYTEALDELWGVFSKDYKASHFLLNIYIPCNEEVY